MKLSMKYIDKLGGREFELFTGKLFKSLDYKNIKVTPLSNDHGLDVIASNSSGKKIGIQCKHRYKPNHKSNYKTVGFRALEEVYTGESIYHTDKGIILTNGLIDNVARHYAKQLHVECWDRPVLKALLDLAKNGSFIPVNTYGSLDPNLLHFKSMLQMRVLFIVLNKVIKSKSRHIIISYPKLLKQLHLYKPIKEHQISGKHVRKLIILVNTPYNYQCKASSTCFSLFSTFNIKGKSKPILDIKYGWNLYNLLTGSPITYDY